MTRLKLGIMMSGRGSNMLALLDACAKGDVQADPALIVSNRPEAEGLRAAAARGVDICAIDHKPFGKDREAFERNLDAALSKAGIELIALAGFMRILTPWFTDRWAGRMINIHPSLLPKYPGLNTHQRALDAGDCEHGCTVHWVTSGVDQGETIAQAAIKVRAGDTAETLRARILVEEHKLFPKALQMACAQILRRAP